MNAKGKSPELRHIKPFFFFYHSFSILILVYLNLYRDLNGKKSRMELPYVYYCQKPLWQLHAAQKEEPKLFSKIFIIYACFWNPKIFLTQKVSYKYDNIP